MSEKVISSQRILLSNFRNAFRSICFVGNHFGCNQVAMEESEKKVLKCLCKNSAKTNNCDRNNFMLQKEQSCSRQIYTQKTK